MKRPVGVTVIAILSLLGSAFTLAMGIVMLVVMMLAPIPRSNQFPGSPVLFRVIFLLASLMYLLPAIWGILTGIGLWRLRNCARISTIVFSVLLVLMGGFGGLTSLVMPMPAVPNSPADPSVLAGVRLVMGVFSLALLGIGVWWLVFFNRPKVKEQFGQPPVVAGGSTLQTVYAVQALPVGATATGTARRPLSITIIAWLLLVGCLFIPLGLALRGPAMLFTKLLTGWPAVSLYVVFAVAQLAIGVGLLRLKPAARVAAIAYFAFAFVNTAVFYFAPGGRARMVALLESQQSMFPWMRLWQNHPEFQVDLTPSLVLGAAAGLVLVIVQIYFLVTRKLAFERAAAELESGANRA